MSTITKEWLQSQISEIKAVGITDSNTLQAFEIALASLEAEPVYQIYGNNDDTWSDVDEEEMIRLRSDGEDTRTLYTAQPAPANAEPVAWLWSHRKHPSEVTLVRPEDDEKAEPGLWSGWSCQALCTEVPTSTPIKDHQIRELVNELRDIAIEYHGTQQLRERIARTIRAAMLQGAEPVTTAYKLPFEQWLSQQGERIEIDCGCVSVEVFMHWLRMAYGAGNSPVIPECSCHACRPVTFADSRFVVCPDCGNKRCPHANDHRNACTGSNQPGQEGSAYPAAPQQEAKNV